MDGSKSRKLSTYKDGNLSACENRELISAKVRNLSAKDGNLSAKDGNINTKVRKLIPNKNCNCEKLKTKIFLFRM